MLLERRRLSPADLRLLVAVREDPLTVAELADMLGWDFTEASRVGMRLVARGFVHSRYDSTQRATYLGITPRGLRTVRPLLTAVSPEQIALHDEDRVRAAGLEALDRRAART